jgi:hypothetical protein
MTIKIESSNYSSKSDKKLNEKTSTKTRKPMDSLPEGVEEIFLDENPLDFMTKYVSKRVKNEETLIKLAILVMASTYTPNPLNIALESPQSEGKSYSLVEVSKLFPKNDVWDLGGMTPQVLTRERGYLVDRETGKRIDKDINEIGEEIDALGNSKDEKLKREKLESQLHDILQNAVKIVDMQGKILLFLEAPQAKTFSTLRPILSRDKYEVEFKFVDRAYKNGKNVTMEARIRGWPVAVYATADAPRGNIWDQIRSRFIIVSPNMSKEKYKAANEYTASKYGSISIPSELAKEDKELKQCTDYIGTMKQILYSEFDKISHKSYYSPENVSFTWNPLAEKLEKSFPSNTGQTMRDFKYFMALMDVSCLFSLLYRPYFEVDDHPHWIVTKPDLKTVSEVFDNYHFFIKCGELPIKIFESVILNMNLNHKTVDDEEYGFTKNDLRNALGDLGISKGDRTIKESILNPLEELGLLTTSKSKNDKRVTVYVPFSEEYLNLLEDSFLKIKYGSDEFKKDYEGIRNKCTKLRGKYINSESDEDDIEENILEVICNHYFSDHIFNSSVEPPESENTHKYKLKIDYSNKNDFSEEKETQIERFPNENEVSKIEYEDLDYIDQAVIETIEKHEIFMDTQNVVDKVIEKYLSLDRFDVAKHFDRLYKAGTFIQSKLNQNFSLKINPEKIVKGD